MSKIMNRLPHEIVGSSAFAEHQSINKYTENQSVLDSDVPYYIPRAFEHRDESRDNDYRALQSEMMDNGWALEEDDNGSKYFTHPTYRGKRYQVYVHHLKNGKTIMLPLVPQDEDPKGLGCSIHTNSNGMFYEVRSNRWVSFYEDRSGKRRLQYNAYLSRREEKKKEYEVMLKQQGQSKM